MKTEIHKLRKIIKNSLSNIFSLRSHEDYEPLSIIKSVKSHVGIELHRKRFGLFNKKLTFWLRSDGLILRYFNDLNDHMEYLTLDLNNPQLFNNIRLELIKIFNKYQYVIEVKQVIQEIEKLNV